MSIKDELISEQIDIIVMGNKGNELLSLILGKEVEKVEPSDGSYVKKLDKVLGKQIGVEEDKIEGTLGRIKKYTKTLLTDSFWVRFHFFLHNLTLYDPIISSISSGPIKICILASDEECPPTPQLKKLLIQNPCNPSFEYSTETVPNTSQKATRDQAILEAKVWDQLHSTKINDFSSLLCIRVIEGDRLIEETSNLKLTINQILRWIVDRHFENEHRIRLKSQLGDEIENYCEIKEKRYCNIM